MDDKALPADSLLVARAVRDACLQAVITAYEDAAMNGLCHEGVWECAVDAVRSLNLEQLLGAMLKERQNA